jgi:hypothetical protein
MERCLPNAHNRYDVFHIIQNMHGFGWRLVDHHMLECHRAVTKEEFKDKMAKWKKAHSPSATYAMKIPKRNGVLTQL